MSLKKTKSHTQNSEQRCRVYVARQANTGGLNADLDRYVADPGDGAPEPGETPADMEGFNASSFRFRGRRRLVLGLQRSDGPDNDGLNGSRLAIRFRELRAVRPIGMMEKPRQSLETFCRSLSVRCHPDLGNDPSHVACVRPAVNAKHRRDPADESNARGTVGSDWYGDTGSVPERTE
jgi:hypothetical protein